MKTLVPTLLIIFSLTCFAFLSKSQAVIPPPDGGYPGGNTGEGQSALLSLTTGTYNTALGLYSLLSDSTGSFNTADGGFALFNNTTGQLNTATGAAALKYNTAGVANTAVGVNALLSNTTGTSNTAIGIEALWFNTTGGVNTAIGDQALLSNVTGNGNTAIGDAAGSAITGDNNICIGSGVNGSSSESFTIRIGDNIPLGGSACYIGGIYGQTASGAAVLIDSSGKLSTETSSKPFKEDIKPMDAASEALFRFQPVAFHYKKDIDPTGTRQLGLVAEDVEKVNPDLVVRDKEGKPYSVRYNQVNAMLLNEFLKEHRKVQEQQQEIDSLMAELREQRNLIQKVSDRVEMMEPEELLTKNP